MGLHHYIRYVSCDFAQNLDTIRFLVKHNADVNAIDDDGKTPLHYSYGAILPYNENIIKFLAEIINEDINENEN